MDDLKISHKDLALVDKVIASLSAEYCKVGEMEVRRGKIYDYLGMILDFSNDGKFIVEMEDHLDTILSGLPGTWTEWQPLLHQITCSRRAVPLPN